MLGSGMAKKEPGGRRRNRRPQMNFFDTLYRDETGATAIEYGLIAALIAVAAITAMQGLGTNLTKTFDITSTKMKAGNDKAA
jgi:pilus assembly protein Flp/PilA